MAGGVFQSALLNGMTIRESATDGSDFTNPAADYRRLFLGEDGQLHLKDSAGAVTNAALAFPVGTSFPGTPSNDDLFYRTDRDLLYFYNGTRWLTVTLHEFPMFGGSDALMPFSATQSGIRAAAPSAGVYDLWLENYQASFYVVAGTALSASHKWTCVLNKAPSDTSVATITIDSGSLNVHRTSGQVSIGALLGTSFFTLYVTTTKTGTPGNLYFHPTVTYRMVG
jgi:hypothetical protein